MFFKNDNSEKVFNQINEKLSPSIDIVKKDVESKGKKLSILYYKSLVDEMNIQTIVIKPFFEIEQLSEFSNHLQSNPKTKNFQDEADALQELLSGRILLLLEHFLFLIDFKKDVDDTLSESSVETTIQGPHLALSNNLAINITLIRERYPQTSLKVKNTVVGSVSRTKVAILYDEQTVNKDVLIKAQKMLNELNVDLFQSGEQLNDLITRRNRSLFPTIMMTERPDRVVYNIAQGKIVLIVSGSPFAIIIPTVFYDFMTSMAEVYQPFWTSRFLLSLRYIGLLFTITLPAFYVAVTSYSPELFRVQLALSIAGSRANVPYPSYLEVLFMLLMMELLTEASIRLPKTIGQTATTVGGLILGQAATDASLVSNIMIIIVSAVAISNFVIPISTLSFSFRLTKYILLFIAIFFGLVGIVIGIFVLIAYLVNLDSFGQPYLKLFLAKPSESKKMFKT
ncbi:spore germination protein [Schinkia azotoformans]|uniref:spore germination protein n=1 Tax=Schinkia azotoformans TaxID=1454 RepID=UPI002DB9F9A1|nr:spore germination protein [Schinkia azotoformans]MEC1720131.1 spore germination protein [Schinkia azotoformans]MED4414154.1 spore germination protein [Schinkia azotoformans]